jgi:hypothetical protein
MELEAAGHVSKTKQVAELTEQLAAAKSGIDRMAKTARAAAAREESLLTAKAQGDLAIEQVRRAPDLSPPPLSLTHASSNNTYLVVIHPFTSVYVSEDWVNGCWWVGPCLL